MPTSPYKYFDPQITGRFGKLGLIARQTVEGFITGLHKSPHHGFSVEFSEHREYVPGDEIRHLDWKTLARTDRYFIKQYEQETNLRCHLLLDCSASMAFSSTASDVRVKGPRRPASTPAQAPAASLPTKFDYAAQLAAMIAYLLVRQADSVGLVAFDTATRFHLPPGATPSHLDRLFRGLEALAPSRQTGMATLFHQFADNLGKRGLVVLFSDLYDEPAEVIKALRHFRHRHHQVIVFHLFDPVELDLPYGQLLNFVDLETQEKVQIDPKAIRAEYQQELQDFIATYRRACTDAAIDYVLVRTDTPFDRVLREYLAMRARR